MKAWLPGRGLCHAGRSTLRFASPPQTASSAACSTQPLAPLRSRLRSSRLRSCMSEPRPPRGRPYCSSSTHKNTTTHRTRRAERRRQRRRRCVQTSTATAPCTGRVRQTQLKSTCCAPKGCSRAAPTQRRAAWQTRPGLRPVQLAKGQHTGRQKPSILGGIQGSRAGRPQLSALDNQELSASVSKFRVQNCSARQASQR